MPLTRQILGFQGFPEKPQSMPFGNFSNAPKQRSQTLQRLLKMTKNDQKSVPEAFLEYIRKILKQKLTLAQTAHSPTVLSHGPHQSHEFHANRKILIFGTGKKF